jgi:hypothetical protein
MLYGKGFYRPQQRIKEVQLECLENVLGESYDKSL